MQPQPHPHPQSYEQLEDYQEEENDQHVINIFYEENIEDYEELVTNEMDIKLIFEEPLQHHHHQQQQHTSTESTATTTTTSTSSEVLTELIEKFSIKEHIDPENNVLNLKTLIEEITNMCNISFENAGMFMNCGIEPISRDIKIPVQDFVKNKEITIKARKIKHVHILHKLMATGNLRKSLDEDSNKAAEQLEEESNSHLPPNNPNNNNLIYEESSKSRRTKERRIGYIIQKVLFCCLYLFVEVIEWRNYYSGTVNENNQQTKLSLEDAAKEVNISKKSLDDYLFQIRYGYNCGFNFNEHYNDKVGILRDFVRQKKKIAKAESKAKKIEEKVVNRI